MQKTISINYILLLGLSSAVSYADSYIGQDNLSGNSSLNYWTAERLSHAKEMSLPKPNPDNLKEIPASDRTPAGSDYQDGAPPEDTIEPHMQPFYKPTNLVSENNFNGSASFDRGSSGFNYSSSRLIPLSADLTYPYRAVGKLFFTIPAQGDYVCSASVINKRVVVTAGHCVHRGSGGSAGYFTNFLFIPAYRDGNAPYQAWGWTHVLTTTAWATGGGGVPNAGDYAMLEIADQPINNIVKKVGDVTGYLGYQTQALIPNHAHLLGYPCNLDYCEKMHQVTAQSARQVAPNNVEYGSDMGGGSSGGPWVQNFGAPATGQTGGLNPGINRVIGITSYGYVTPDYKAQGSSILDSNFTSLLNNLCAHEVGNCA